MSENNTKLVTKGVESYQQEFSEGERASIDIITAAVRDRDGEMVLPQGIDLTDYRKNPVVIWGHKHSDGLPIGKNIWIKYDKVKNALIAKTQYADHTFANEVYEYRKNFPLGVSIGFIAKEWLDKDEFDDVTLKSIGLTKKDVAGVNRIFTKCSLLEYSLVNIPSVADATMLAINKGLMSKEEAIENNFPIKEINLESIQSEEPQKELDLENIEIKDETVTKPETTENYHRIPVIPKEQFVQTSFRTIDITTGIKAVIGNLKSDPNGSTKVHTYLFDVNKFSMSEAEAWVEAHKKEISDENVEVKSVGSSSLPTSDKSEWDSAAAISKMSSAAGGPNKDEIDWTKYSKGFAYFDSSNKENFGSYKLPFADVIGGTLTAVWGGVNAAMAAVNGARTPMSIPESDRKAAYNLLKSYYTKFDKEAPEFKDISEDIEEKAKNPCKKEICDGEGCQEFDSCSESMKKAKDSSEEPMDGNEEPMPCEDGGECPGMNCPQHKACSKPEKKGIDKSVGEMTLKIKVDDIELDTIKKLLDEVELLKEEVSALKEKNNSETEDLVKKLNFDPTTLMNEDGSFKNINEFPEGAFSNIEKIEFNKEGKIKNILFVQKSIVLGEIVEILDPEEKEINLEAIEQKEGKSALDESLEIDITKEQLGELIKDAILNVTKEMKKNNEIDLSQITADALKKAKGEIF